MNRSDNTHEVADGLREMRRGEGVVWSVDVSRWGPSPTPQAITIIRETDNQDVTNAFTTTATPTASGNDIVLPEVTVPAGAALGYYRLNFPFEAGGFSPGIPFIRFLVKV